MIYQLQYTKHFQKKYRKISDKKPDLIKRIQNTLNSLSENPTHKSLRTHKINTKKGYVMSSYVTSDLRIIWSLEDIETILLLDIGGHEGGNSVY